MNLKSIAQEFSSLDAARTFFEAQRWPDGTVCPFCGVIGESYRLKAKADSKSPVRSSRGLEMCWLPQAIHGNERHNL